MDTIAYELQADVVVKPHGTFNVTYVVVNGFRIGFMNTDQAHIFGTLGDGVTGVGHCFLDTAGARERMAREIVEAFQARLGAVAGWPLAFYSAWQQTDTCAHSLDDIVGYVVRQTFDNGLPLFDSSRALCGFDVASIDGANRFGDALEIAYAFRRVPGSYAVVDNVYACGHRSDIGRTVVNGA